jgi:hypothetical protein
MVTVWVPIIGGAGALKPLLKPVMGAAAAMFRASVPGMPGGSPKPGSTPPAGG